MREAAEDHHEDEIAGVGPVREQGIGEPRRHREQRSAHRAEDGGDAERRKPIPPHAHAHALRLLGILPDGAQAETERGVHDAPHHEDGHREQSERVVVVRPNEELHLAEPREGQPAQAGSKHAHAFIAAGERIELVEERVEEHAEGEGEHPEVDAHVAHAEQPDGHGHHEPGQGGGEQDDLEGQDGELARHEGRRVGAQGHEEGVTEGQEPGDAEEQVEAEERDAVGEEGQHEGGVVLATGEGHEEHDPEDEGQREPPHQAVARAKSPAGRSTSTAMTMT